MPSRLLKLAKPLCVWISDLSFNSNYLKGKCLSQCAVGVVRGFRALWRRNSLWLVPPLLAQEVAIGEHCWIGMNSTLMQGVVLGLQSIVGAGAVVTKSFPGGFCVLGGVPARVIGIIERPATSFQP